MHCAQYYQFCSGEELPTSQLTYLEANATCTENAVEVTERHVVSLGVLCEDSLTGELFYVRVDQTFECAAAAHNSDVGIFGDETRFICGESATFPVGSNSSQIVRNVTITTDDRWTTDQSQCFNFVAASEQAKFLTPNRPTSSPTTTPDAFPSTAPSAKTVSESPSILVETDAPTVAPIVEVAVASPISNTNNSGNSIAVVAIGVAGAGVVIAAVIGFFVIYNQKSQARKENKPANASIEPESNDDNNGFESLVQLPPSICEPATPHNPLTEAPAEKRDVYVPDLNMPMRTNISPQTASSQRMQQHPAKHDLDVKDQCRSVAAMVPQSPPPALVSYPANHVLDVKDQCRSVDMVPSSPPPPPAVVSQSDSNVPFAVAVGVSTTIANIPFASSSASPTEEQSGRASSDV